MLRLALTALILLLAQIVLSAAAAHEVRPAYLSLTERAPEIYDVVWHRPVIGNKAAPLEPKFPDSCQYKYLSHMVLQERAARFQYELNCVSEGLRGREIFFDGLAVSLTDVLVKIDFVEGGDVSHLVRASDPVYKVPDVLKKRDVAFTYTVLGIDHILRGWDHLLFVLALAMLIRSRRELLGAVTGFTLGHSVTLALVVLGVTPSPSPIIELLIALSIVFLAYEGRRIELGAIKESLIGQFPSRIAAMFGLIHGFGFAGALTEIGLSTDELLLSLFSFNLGIEFGQVLFISLLTVTSIFLQRWGERQHYYSRTVVYYIIGIVSSYWVFERGLAHWF